eukprot:1570285-Rhodomonas_salina.1
MVCVQGTWGVRRRRPLHVPMPYPILLSHVPYKPSVCCYAMCGTSLPYAPIPCMVLAYRILLCDVP